MPSGRLTAIAAVLLTAVGVVLAIVVAVQNFPRDLGVAACAVLAVVVGWYAVMRRGVLRLVAAPALAALLVAVGWLLSRDLATTLAVGATLVLAVAVARRALQRRVDLRRADPPRRPVLFYNPRSGGGKAARFDLPQAARARGIEPIELVPGQDLETLVRDAVSAGADGLAMAGGDGSQAIVAAVAAERGLPYACIPAGTRNHFALDLGVDRDDVVGALDAFVDGGERVVDLADVNGRVFVNNVSVGLYAEAVQRPGYREAKLRTLLDTAPDAFREDEDGTPQLEWVTSAGPVRARGAVMLVSNNRYRLGRIVASGTRPRLDGAELGIAVLETPRRPAGLFARRALRQWGAPTFEVRATRAVPTGIDGESVLLAAPLRFRLHRGVLRARIARGHPGASPSARLPESPWGVMRVLLGIAAGHDPRRAELEPSGPARRLVLGEASVVRTR